ncbi:heparan sulfate 2-O-sulfotransferase 1-like [Homalodisca vitripennis]|uniref:heparan sulfate 2-O-sulfotransferase 1-like n=1 Tax=Homalodisca vitripennis TaxID=197043 RepID=UPI001EEA1137|nr:heparan sulfate 2-O-sulfotransferase 1-like [Homalodisca vitripennis]XP_046681037.1 heparan sulfate 2-O-sulfotransferase 1-like [Homalodisca vitripennis]
MAKLIHTNLEKFIKYTFTKRRTYKTCIYILLMVATLIGTTVLRTKKSLYVLIPEDEEIRLNEVTPSQSTRKVTKSLSEMLATVPELSDHVLFFNRVPKAGSEMLVLLLQWMQGLNGYKHVRLGGGNTRRLSRHQQEQLVEKITESLHDATIPLSFDRHVYFINFTSFGRQSPTYINLVRDPVDKAVSRFYYSRVTPNPKKSRSAPCDTAASPALHGCQLRRVCAYCRPRVQLPDWPPLRSCHPLLLWPRPFLHGPERSLGLRASQRQRGTLLSCGGGPGGT